MGIKIDGLAAAVQAELQGYSAQVAGRVKAAAKRVAKEAAGQLKQTSPNRTGDYRKGWRSRAELVGITGDVYQVYNATDWQLTHLLENGHIGRDGKRVKPFAHIAQVEAQAIDSFTKEVERAVTQ